MAPGYVPRRGERLKRTVLKSTVQDRVIAAGKWPEAFAELMANPVMFARWYVPCRPAVYSDDPDTVKVIQSLGLDPVEILAPETV